MNTKVLVFLGLVAVAAGGSSEEFVYRPPRFQPTSDESGEGYVYVAPRASSEESRERFVYLPPRASSEESRERIVYRPASSEESRERVVFRPRPVSSEESRERVVYRPPRTSSEESRESFESTEAHYSFDWAVKHDPSRNDFGHQETRDGEHTRGAYYVHLPDGRLQKVNYGVEGDSGYVADVSYEGEAQFPDSYESRESNESDESFEAPRYVPPRPRFHSEESNKSFEAPRFVRFDSNESNESFETPRYVPPRPVYSVPDSNESK